MNVVIQSISDTSPFNVYTPESDLLPLTPIVGVFCFFGIVERGPKDGVDEDPRGDRRTNYTIHNNNRGKISTPLPPCFSNTMNGFQYVVPSPSRRETGSTGRYRTLETQC